MPCFQARRAIIHETRNPLIIRIVDSLLGIMERIYGIGIDLVNVARIDHAIARWGETFLRRTFTSQEIAYCSKKAFPFQHYGARFAAKEAVFKALGTGWAKGVTWLDIEVCVNPDSGEPSAVLSGAAREILEPFAPFRVLLTLSHDKDYAIAQAMILIERAVSTST